MIRTDWDGYYRRPNPFHAVLKRIVCRVVVRCAVDFAPRLHPLTVAELGGGNSCFYEALSGVLDPETYIVVDDSAAGLELLRRRAVRPDRLRLLRRDILASPLPFSADVVFSVGLIEHFHGADLTRIVERHLEALTPGGLLILGFPTPTWAYRLIRGAAERLRCWRFPDEVPLPRAAVERLVAPGGELLMSRIVWSIGATQAFVALRKKPAGEGA
jgi:SAM-dependent methyltransferase